MPHAPATWRDLRSAIPALLFGLGCFGLFFHEEIAAAFRVWISSTAYNHCFLVLPIAAYLAWDRRALLADASVRPAPFLALAGLPLALAWLAAERVGIMEGRQLVAMCFVELLFLVVLGWPVWRRLSAPLLYLFFLVPFGAFTTPLLQSLTAWFTITGLDLLGIPNFSDGYTIEISSGSFYVAEACAGLRFLIASIAFGVLYACLMYRSLLRRIAFIGASVVVPIVANGFRALGIVALGDILGSAEAAVADHIIYGWLFFSVVIFLLTLIGLPFRQEPHWRPVPPEKGRGRAMRPVSSLVAACVLVLVALAGPAVANRLDKKAAEAKLVAAPPSFASTAVCAPVSSATPADGNGIPAPGSVAVEHFLCGDQQFVMRIEVFPPRVSPSGIVAERRRLSGEFEGDDVESVAIHAGGVDWRLTQSEDQRRAVATALWIEGIPSAGGLKTRIRQARNSLLGSDLPPVLVAVTPDLGSGSGPNGGPARAKGLVQAFLDSQTDLPDQIRSMAAAAADPALAGKE
jgi:exosortase A